MMFAFKSCDRIIYTMVFCRDWLVVGTSGGALGWRWTDVLASQGQLEIQWGAFYTQRACLVWFRAPFTHRDTPSTVFAANVLHAGQGGAIGSLLSEEHFLDIESPLDCARKGQRQKKKERDKLSERIVGYPEGDYPFGMFESC